MQIYPHRYEVTPDQSEISFEVQTKKAAELVQCWIQGVHCEQCEEFVAPQFSLARSAGTQWTLSWEPELDRELEITIYASGPNGQLVQPLTLVPVAEKAETKAEDPRARKGKLIVALIEKGVDPAAAVAQVEEKLAAEG